MGTPKGRDAMRVELGIERLIDDQAGLLTGARVGAVVHPASVLPDLRHTVDALVGDKRFELVSLFGPQHGARGEKQDNMIESEFYRDPETGLPVHSLYGSTRSPEEGMLEDLDVLIYDLQDVGTRVYTFIHTMACCMQACAKFRKRMVIADRPNPIGGVAVEGGLLDPAYRSFVGLYPIPMRHGMTVGELARLLNSEYGIGCDLAVVPMKGWRRSMWFDQTGLPWVQPSPNLPTLESAVVYPGTVLVEGTSLSEGRGTTRPFEYVGAPYIRPGELAPGLNSLGLPGVVFRPAYFEPTFQKWVGAMCGGVQVHVRDRNCFEPYLTGITIIAFIRSLYPDSFSWRQPPYEYEYEKLPIEILCGGRTVPGLIERGAASAEIRDSWREDVALFLKQRASYLLYEE
jgi:uncharacterized protein YbbC (DUF1343 family)